MLPFKVTKKYARGPSEDDVALFKKQDDATDFIRMALTRNANGLKENINYLLYDSGELLETFDANSAEASQGGSQQKTSTQAFRPSPLQTAPRPSGMPPSSFKDVDDKNKS
jgi:hypothetical protein